MNKKILIVCILSFLILGGCSKKDTSEGEIEKVNYKETSEITNYVKIDTNKGIMLVELFPDIAPITVENFKKLVNDKFYDNLTFHRIVENFMIQGGDPEGTGMGGSKDKIKGEFKSNGVENNLSHTRGVISMARSGDPNSASSQFFIVHQDTTSLNGDYAAFGKLIAGFETLDKLASVSVNGETPVSPPKINSMRFVTIEK